MELLVGTDSTWSLRAWICCQLTNTNIMVNVIDLTKLDYKVNILQTSPSGLVPALVNGPLVIHDSLAIIEYLNECSDTKLFPNAVEERALSRSLCSELHSGFINLRTQCPFSLDKVNPLTDYNDGIKSELSRLEAIFESANLPFMFSTAGAVDAFYAILAFRLKAYGITLNGQAGKYQQSLLEWPLLQQAISQAESWKNT